MFTSRFSFSLLAMLLILLVGCGKVEPSSKAAPTGSTIYHCPMHPQIVQDKPGVCPICNMDLVAIGNDSSGANGAEGTALQVSPEALKTLEVRTEKVTRRPVKDSGDTVLSIPTKALIREGENPSVVVQVGPGRFQLRSVRIGLETPQRLEILEGLNENEEVVTSGQFLLASEISLRLKAAKIQSGVDRE